jgi:DNA-binding response OmpR family regulator
MSGSILLVEDEELVGTMVRMNLEGIGYKVDWVKNGRQALETAQRQHFDLILLDISLPEKDGFEILVTLRKQGYNTPIMMLTARSDTSYKVNALDSGADDYLPKPFDVAEMIARVNALVRRSQADRQIPSDQRIQIGKYEVNLETREANSNEGEMILSEKEAAILGLLVRARGTVLTRSDILDEVWGMDAMPTERTVDNFIVRLRKLFEIEPDDPKHLITVRGSGYRFIP